MGPVSHLAWPITVDCSGPCLLQLWIGQNYTTALGICSSVWQLSGWFFFPLVSSHYFHRCRLQFSAGLFLHTFECVCVFFAPYHWVCEYHDDIFFFFFCLFCKLWSLFIHAFDPLLSAAWACYNSHTVQELFSSKKGPIHVGTSVAVCSFAMPWYWEHMNPLYNDLWCV